MLFKNYLSSIVTSIIMLVLGACMALVAILYTHQPLAFSNFFVTWGSALTINYLASLLFPAGLWAEKLCATCKAKPGTIGFLLLNSLVSTFVFVTLVSMGMTALQTGFTQAFWAGWLHVYPILFGAGYVVATIASPFVMKLAIKIVQGQVTV